MQDYRVLKIFRDKKGKWHRPLTNVQLEDKEGLRERRLGHVMRINITEPVPEPQLPEIPKQKKTVKKRKRKNANKK